MELLQTDSHRAEPWLFVAMFVALSDDVGKAVEFIDKVLQLHVPAAGAPSALR